MEENKTIKLSALSVLGYRVMHRYRNRDYEEYRALVNVAMDILDQIPKPIQEKLVKSKFLLNEDIS